MSEHKATVEWTRGDQPFSDNRYSRGHDWRFDGGAVVRGSSAPTSVPEPMSDPTAVDPEEALVAAVSSCHMLFFLAYAPGRAWSSTAMPTRRRARWARMSAARSR